MRFRAWMPLLIAAVLAGAGCQPPQPIGGEPRKVAAPKVVTLTPSSTEMLSKLNLFNTIVGRSENCNFPATMASVPVVVKGTAPDYEAIAAAKANVVVYDGALYSENQVEKFKELGMTVVKWDPNTLEEYEKQAFQISQAATGEMSMSEYLDSVYRSIADARGTADRLGVAGSPIAILIGRQGKYLAPGTKSLWGDITGRIGGKLVGTDSTRWEPISLEALVQANPKVIIAGGSGRDILADPALKGVEAVKTKRVYDLNEDVLLRRGARLEQLAEAIGTALAKTAE